MSTGFLTPFRRARMIRGHSGGGGSQQARTPKDAADNLKSTAFARVLDAVCEGEIEGFAHPDDPLQDVYYGGTPVKNPDGSFNYHNVKLDYRFGTQSQMPIDGFSAVENTVGVGIQIKAALGPHTETIVDPNVNAVRVAIATSGFLTSDPTTGDRTGSAVQMMIEVAVQSGPYVQKINTVIDGKSAGKYERDFIIPLSGGAPYHIRVTRITPDPTTSNVSNDTVWDSYTEIVNGKLAYPNTALVGSLISAAEFSSIPVRAYDLYLLRVQVPSNYDPITRSYSGVWDGTFKKAWTDNPAWCFYDIVTNKRYGCGRYIEDSLPNKWTLYKIAKYCDELVDDGFGQFEPRFTCNVYMQTQAEVYDVLNNFSSIFRGIVYMQNGEITAVQDSPQDPWYTFTNANVEAGQFGYTGTARKARHTVCIVSYTDRTQLGKQNLEYVEDQDAILRFGYNPSKINAFGCASRGQAHRAGKWLLFAELKQTEMVSFTTGLEGIAVFPGAIIDVQDSNRAGARVAGRLKSFTTTSVVLDKGIDFNLGDSYDLILTRGDVDLINFQPTSETPHPVTSMRIAIVNPASSMTPIVNANALTLVNPMPTAPMPDSVWRIASNALDSQTFKILSIKEADGKTNKYQIDALKYFKGQFAYIEQDIQLQTKPITVFPGVPKTPTNVVLSEHAVTLGTGQVKSQLTLAWDRLDRGVTYRIEYRKDTDNWQPLQDEGSNSVEISDVIPGSSYQGRVSAISATNLVSAPGYSNLYAITGKTEPPPGLSDLRAYDGLWEIDLFWDFYPNQPDVVSTEISVSLTNDRSTAQVLGNRAFPIDSASELDLPIDSTRYYWGRCVNSSGIWSDYFPLDPFAGVEGHTINDAGRILDLESGIASGTLAGVTLRDRLDALDFPGIGFSDQITEVQSQLTSLYSLVHSIGARLDAPYGDIANAISRIESVAAVSRPTPRQTTAPLAPVLGDAWYDSGSGDALRFWNGTTWVFASSAIVSATQPTGPVVGALWLDSSNAKQVYRIWDGTQWLNTSRPTVYASATPSTAERLVGDTWKNTSDGDLYVFDGTTWVDTQNSDVAAISTQLTALQTTVGNHTTQIQQNISSIGGIAGLYSVKIDNNGHVAGFSLSSVLLANGTAQSDFIIDVNRFAIADGINSTRYPFIVDNGYVIIDQAIIGTASITTLKLAGNAVTIPSSIYIPGSMGLSTAQQQVLALTIDFGANNPASVAVEFVCNIANGGGGNGAGQKFLYRDGVLIYSGQNGIINNIYSNALFGIVKDNPGPGVHTYVLNASYAGAITSASIDGRFMSVTGNLR